MMPKLPPLDLIEDLHDFPGPYLFKIIGTATDGLEAKIIAAIRHELALDQEPSYTKRTTADGKHVAVTVEIILAESIQVHKIYNRLLTVPGVVVLL